MKSYKDYPGYKNMPLVCNLLYHIVDNPNDIKDDKWYVFQEENLDSTDYVELIEFDFVTDAEEYFIFKLRQFEAEGYKESFEELRYAKGAEIKIYMKRDKAIDEWLNRNVELNLCTW
jgi:hypothetical protein